MKTSKKNTAQITIFVWRRNNGIERFLFTGKPNHFETIANATFQALASNPQTKKKTNKKKQAKDWLRMVETYQ